MAFRNPPEWMIGGTILVILAGCAFPLFRRFEVSAGWSLLYAVACGTAAVVAIRVVNLIKDVIDRRR